MNTNTNFYQQNDYKYSEIGIALTDFTYGGMVQMSIPVITPFMDNNNVIDDKERVNKVNIINADTSSLGLTSNEKCEVKNCMSLYVPYYLADYERSPYEHAEVDSDGDSTPAQCHKDFIRLKWDGKKGTKFIILFLGGDNSNPQVIGRVH